MSLLGPKPRVLILRLGLGSWDRENLEQFSARCPVGCEKDTDLVKMDKESVFFTKDVQNGWLKISIMESVENYSYPSFL